MFPCIRWEYLPFYRQYTQYLDVLSFQWYGGGHKSLDSGVSAITLAAALALRSPPYLYLPTWMDTASDAANLASKLRGRGALRYGAIHGGCQTRFALHVSYFLLPGLWALPSLENLLHGWRRSGPSHIVVRTQERASDNQLERRASGGPVWRSCTCPTHEVPDIRYIHAPVQAAITGGPEGTSTETRVDQVAGKRLRMVICSSAVT